MKIVVWALGGGFPAGTKIEIDRAQFDVFRLDYNLRYLWAWANVIEADGPCVAVIFNGYP